MPPPERLPAAFFGHGNPLRTLDLNRFSERWRAFGRQFPSPRAVLCVSAHWYGPGTAVTAQARPPTIHDFGGFPPALFRIQYPAPGAPALAARIRELLAPIDTGLDADRGLDHGAWSVLRHTHPGANIPVVQLRIDARQPGAFHYEVGRRLAALRDEDILIVGSGNIVHNLRRMVWDRPDAPAYRWAEQFNEAVRERLAAGRHEELIDWARLDSADLAVPTPDHYLPLLYVLGMQQPGERVDFATDVIEHGSIGMLSVAFGASAQFAERHTPVSL